MLSDDGEPAAQSTQAVQVVSRGEDIDIGQGGFHSSTGWLVIRRAAQRIEPEHGGGTTLNRPHRFGKLVGVPRIPAITHDQNNSPPIKAAAVVIDERLQRCADPGAAGPPRDLF